MTQLRQYLEDQLAQRVEPAAAINLDDDADGQDEDELEDVADEPHFLPDGREPDPDVDEEREADEPERPMTAGEFVDAISTDPNFEAEHGFSATDFLVWAATCSLREWRDAYAAEGLEAPPRIDVHDLPEPLKLAVVQGQLDERVRRARTEGPR